MLIQLGYIQYKGGTVIDFLKFLANNDVKSLVMYLRTEEGIEKINELLFWSVYQNNLLFTQVLIEKGANVNFKDNLNRSVLSIASYFGFLKVAECLLESGAIISASCMDRAYKGFDNKIQLEILNLFSARGWVNLYLDDLRDTPSGFAVARTVEQAIAIIKTNQVHLLSLDHDLGSDDKGTILPTGYDLVKYICEERLRPANKIYIHTDNVVGRENMYHTLLGARKRGIIDDDIEIYHYPITMNRYSGN